MAALMINQASSSIQQVEHSKNECLNLLSELKTFYPADAHGHYPDTYRLLVTPMLYSAWERCFTLCHAVALRLIRDSTTNAQSLDPSSRAVWLINSPFYNSLVSKLQNQGATEDGKQAKKGHFHALCEFLEKFDAWAAEKLDPSVDTDDLVMTISNVNPDVVAMNAKAIGIDGYPPFKALKLGRLNDLVGRRNEIGHGSIIKPLPNEQFNDLWEFTEALIRDYSDTFVRWIEKNYSSQRKLYKKPNFRHGRKSMGRICMKKRGYKFP